MRTLSATLETAQQSMNYDPLWRVVLTRTGETTQTYTRTRVLSISHTEEPFTQKADIILNNNDGALTALNFEHYQAVISYGMNTSAGEEYSACAPLRVRSQELHSGRGVLKCILHCVGLPDQLGEDKAISSITYPDTDSSTIQTHLNAVIQSNTPPFSAYPVLTVSYDSTDSLIGSFQPKDYYRIDENSTRLDKIQELLGYTGCKLRVEADGAFHILTPVTSGTAYSYEYTFGVLGDHTFLDKTVRNRFINPNREIVVSHSDDSAQFAGTATSATSFALSPKIHTTRLRLASTAQATAIAAAKIEQNELDAERGFVTVPMNVGQEVWDYVRVTDSRQGDTRTGNIQYLKRNVELKDSGLVFNSVICFGKVSSMGLLALGMGMGVDVTYEKLSHEQIIGWLNALQDKIFELVEHHNELENYLRPGNNVKFNKLTVTNQMIIPVWE